MRPLSKSESNLSIWLEGWRRARDPTAAENCGRRHAVLPGVGDFDAANAHWKSDVRLFNSGSTALPVTLSYFPQGDPTHPATTTMTLQPGEVRALDNLIASTLPQAGTMTAGSLLVSSTNPAALVATARTYTQTTSGTYGQFIPAVTTAQS